MTWKTVGVSVIGTSHVKIGKPCQDSHAIQSLKNDCLIGIVADGLGSAERSEVGSCLVVENVMALLEEKLSSAIPETDDAWQDLLRRAFSQARAALEGEAFDTGCSLRELGTTLIIFIAAPGKISIAQIGDGAVVVRSADGKLTTFSSPQRGEFANETVPLTMDGALERVSYSVHPAEIVDIAAFSDGLQNLALISASYEPFEPFFIPLFKFVSASDDILLAQGKLESFLGSERICGKTDDDKTLLLASWKAEV